MISKYKMSLKPQNKSFIDYYNSLVDSIQEKKVLTENNQANNEKKDLPKPSKTKWSQIPKKSRGFKKITSLFVNVANLDLGKIKKNTHPFHPHTAHSVMIAAVLVLILGATAMGYIFSLTNATEQVEAKSISTNIQARLKPDGDYSFGGNYSKDVEKSQKSQKIKVFEEIQMEEKSEKSENSQQTSESESKNNFSAAINQGNQNNQIGRLYFSQNMNSAVKWDSSTMVNLNFDTETVAGNGDISIIWDRLFGTGDRLPLLNGSKCSFSVYQYGTRNLIKTINSTVKNSQCSGLFQAKDQILSSSFQITAQITNNKTKANFNQISTLILQKP